MRRASSVLALLALAACASSDEEVDIDLAADTANLPETEVYLAALSVDGDMLETGAPRNISQNAGYDNQPSFLPGGNAFYYVSEGASGKTDIWRYDLTSDSAVRVYASSEVSEYSPKAAPAGYGVSYIQENEAGDVTRVHHMPPSGGAGAPVADFAPLGYYAWLQDGESLAVYLRSEPAALHIVDVASGVTTQVAEDIGRSLHAAPDGMLVYFTRTDAAGVQQVTWFDVQTGALETVAALPEDVQDFTPVFSAEGELQGLLAGSGVTLLYWSMASDGAGWREIADFEGNRLKNITRIAVSDDLGLIVFVAEPD